MEDSWRTLIGTANRFNVTFYSINSPALNTASVNGEQVSELQEEASAARLKTLTHGNGTVTPAIAKVQDRASGMADGQRKLADLAKSTGGFLIASPIDFRSSFGKISQDIQRYYQVAYNPQTEKYDGAFHKIEVRAKRPNLRIQSRAGYLAIPAAAGKERLH